MPERLLPLAAAAVVYALLVVAFWIAYTCVVSLKGASWGGYRSQMWHGFAPLVLMSLSRTLSYFYLPITSATLSLLACRSVEVPQVSGGGKVTFVTQSHWVLVSCWCRLLVE